MSTETTIEDFGQLATDTEALLKRWKSAAANEARDNLALGRELITRLYTANEAFKEMAEILGERGLHPSSMKELEFF